MLTRMARRLRGSQLSGVTRMPSMSSAAALRKMAPMLVESQTPSMMQMRWASRSTSSTSRLGAAHGAEHAARQRVARQLRQQVAVARVDGYVARAADDVGSVARQMTALAQQRYGLEASVKRHADDLRAFGYEESCLVLHVAAKLCLSQRGEHLYARLGERCQFNDVLHTADGVGGDVKQEKGRTRRSSLFTVLHRMLWCGITQLR